jgi:predicted ATP-dependent serine protease
MTKGIDVNRIALLIAVLEKIVGLFLQAQDVFINVVGGVKIDEPAVDLSLALAMASSFKNIPLPSQTIMFGEVGWPAKSEPSPTLNSDCEKQKSSDLRGVFCRFTPKTSLVNVCDSNVWRGLARRCHRSCIHPLIAF